MNSKLAVGLVFGLLTGLAIASVGRSPEVQAQQSQKGQEWEYKVVVFRVDSGTQTKQLNTLAAGGWEYVGLLYASSRGGEPRYLPSVAFRRPKE